MYTFKQWILKDKIDWCYLSENPNAIHLLERNIDKINWFLLSSNPNIFEIEIDYEHLKKRMWHFGFGSDLMENRFDPKNINKFCDWGFDDEFEEE